MFTHTQSTAGQAVRERGGGRERGEGRRGSEEREMERERERERERRGRGGEACGVLMY